MLADDELAFRRIWDLFSRIRDSAENRRPMVLILPNLHPQYVKLAWLINRHRVSCKYLHIFNMDEWADQDGNIAPESWPNGLMYGMKNYFYRRLDEDLRPPEKQIRGPNNGNLKNYAKMIEDAGGTDVCDGGIGWRRATWPSSTRAPPVRHRGPGGVQGHGAAGGDPQPLHRGPDGPGRGLRHERRLVLGPAQGGDHRPGPDPGRAPAQLLEQLHPRPTQISWQRFSVRLAAHGRRARTCPLRCCSWGRRTCM